MPSRLKFVVAYDGAPFAGWQSQAKGNTVQDHLEKAFALVAQKPVRVHGAGRTDTGVHALGQCAHVDLSDQRLTAETWVRALNASLPPAIRVLRCRYVPRSFHARFSAKGKLYRYRIWNDTVLPPFEHGRAWHLAAPLDLRRMAREARAFLGRHDFASFAANRGHPVENTVRCISAVRWRKKGKLIEFEFDGDGFLYKMVRLMTGALVRHGRGQTPAGEIRQRLEAPSRTSGTARFAAPAEGLFLVRVRY
ncbi:MAG: tRNA pseudouridine(38-40) synthase TruA [Chthoniobacterales bacterium]